MDSRQEMKQALGILEQTISILRAEGKEVPDTAFHIPPLLNQAFQAAIDEFPEKQRDELQDQVNLKLAQLVRDYASKLSEK